MASYRRFSKKKYPDLQALLKRMASADSEAYDLLFRKYYGPMVLYADRMLNHKSANENGVVDF